MRITVLVPTGHYLRRLRQMYAMFFGALIGLAVIAVAAGYGFGRWLTGELQGVARIMTQSLRQRDESETVAMPISPVVEIRGLAVHCREVLVRFAARSRELKHVNQTLESQAKS